MYGYVHISAAMYLAELSKQRALSTIRRNHAAINRACFQIKYVRVQTCLPINGQTWAWTWRRAGTCAARDNPFVTLSSRQICLLSFNNNNDNDDSFFLA